jgi:exonuclease VII small subunit
MKNKQKQPKTALGAVVVEMNALQNSENGEAQHIQETPTETEPPKEAKSIEEVMAENERLRRQLESQPKTLEEKIDFFKQKEDLIKQLTRLNGKRESLYGVLSLSQEAAEKDEFFSDAFSIVVNHKAGYKEDEVFRLNNPVLIGELLQFVIARLDIKREELQYLISA